MSLAAKEELRLRQRLLNQLIAISRKSVIPAAARTALASIGVSKIIRAATINVRSKNEIKVPFASVVILASASSLLHRFVLMIPRMFV